MALLPILRYPDPRLHTRAAPVREVNDEIRKLVADMAETMYEAPGIGLAATQVDVISASWSSTSPKTNRPCWP
jgi:peptide deformylase